MSRQFTSWTFVKPREQSFYFHLWFLDEPRIPHGMECIARSISGSLYEAKRKYDSNHLCFMYSTHLDIVPETITSAFRSVLPEKSCFTTDHRWLLMVFRCHNLTRAIFSTKCSMLHPLKCFHDVFYASFANSYHADGMKSFHHYTQRLIRGNVLKSIERICPLVTGIKSCIIRNDVLAVQD